MFEMCWKQVEKVGWKSVLKISEHVENCNACSKLLNIGYVLDETNTDVHRYNLKNLF